MIYNENKSEYTVECSQRKFYSCSSVLGIGDDMGWKGFSYGGDGGEYSFDWTQEEKDELADEMINRWAKWKNE